VTGFSPAITLLRLLLVNILYGILNALLTIISTSSGKGCPSNRIAVKYVRGGKV